MDPDDLPALFHERSVRVGQAISAGRRATRRRSTRPTADRSPGLGAPTTAAAAAAAAGEDVGADAASAAGPARPGRTVHFDTAADAGPPEPAVDTSTEPLVQPEVREAESDDEEPGEEEELFFDEHLIDVEDLLARYEVSAAKGLSTEGALRRLRQSGYNDYQKPKLSVLQTIGLILRSMLGYFVPLLYVGVLLAFVDYAIDPLSWRNIFTGVVLFLAAVVVSTISYIELRRKATATTDLQAMMPQTARVYRDGLLRVLPARELVVGDIIELEQGDAVPADVRVIRETGCRVDVSVLTGRHDLVGCSVDKTSDNPLQTENLLFFGSTVQEGSLTAVVIFTGKHTMLGRLARTMVNRRQQMSVVHKELSKFVVVMAFWSVLLACIFLIWTIVINYLAIDAAILSIGIIAGMVPEALIVTAKVLFHHVQKRMDARKIVVRQATVMEVVGCATVICTDKNGVLTQNKIELVHIWADGKVIACRTYDRVSQDTLGRCLGTPTMSILIRAAALCNRAMFGDNQENVPAHQRDVVGDPADAALLRFAESAIDVTRLREEYPKCAEGLWSSEHRYQLSVHELTDDTGVVGHLVLMRASAATILDYCTSIVLDGEVRPLDDELREWCVAAMDLLAAHGERVHGLAQRVLPIAEFPAGFAFDVIDLNFPLSELEFIGFVGLLDPARTEIPPAVQACREASIKVVVTTGDHAETAKAIALSVGLIPAGRPVTIVRSLSFDATGRLDVPPDHAVIVTGDVVDQLRDADWDAILDHENVVFAQTSAQQKERLIGHNRRRRHVVVATGDSVNDSGALRAANVGAALGMKGTDVSRAAASLVLQDDSFATVVTAVAEGRLLFDNLAKTLAYALSSNVADVVPFFLLLFFKLPLAVTTSLILCIDCGTDLLPAIALAYEEPERDLMARPPRKLHARVMTRQMLMVALAHVGVLQCLAALFAFLVALGDLGFAPWMIYGAGMEWADPTVMINARGAVYREEALAYAQTAYFVGTVVMQWADVVISKTRRQSVFRHGFRNRRLTWAVLLCTVVVVLMVYFPWFNPLFGTRILAFVHLLPALPFAVFLVVYDELRKWHIRRHPDGTAAGDVARWDDGHR